MSLLGEYKINFRIGLLFLLHPERGHIQFPPAPAKQLLPDHLFRKSSPINIRQRNILEIQGLYAETVIDQAGVQHLQARTELFVRVDRQLILLDRVAQVQQHGALQLPHAVANVHRTIAAVPELFEGDPIPALFRRGFNDMPDHISLVGGGGVFADVVLIGRQQAGVHRRELREIPRFHITADCLGHAADKRIKTEQTGQLVSAVLADKRIADNEFIDITNRFWNDKE